MRVSAGLPPLKQLYLALFAYGTETRLTQLNEMPAEFSFLEVSLVALEK
jgi:hypothetical protein